MATSLNLTLRCQSKTLIIGTDSNNWVSVSLQSVAQTGASPSPQSSSLNTTVPVAEDTFIMGNLYKVGITDEITT